jgi:retron-type reverse transcriptase
MHGILSLTHFATDAFAPFDYDPVYNSSAGDDVFHAELGSNLEITTANSLCRVPPTLAATISYEKLSCALEQMRHGGQSPGYDGIKYADLGRSESAAMIRSALRSIATKTYRPSPPRIIRIPKGDGRFRELKLRSIIDRMIAKAVVNGLLARLDAEFLPNSLGFRPGRNIWQLLAALAYAIDTTGYTYFIQDDIRDAFPSVPIAAALQCYQRYIHDAELLWLIETTLRGHDGSARTVGIDQGCPLSPLTLNVLMHHILDQPLSAAGLGYPVWYRYADNLAYLCRTATDARQAIQRARDLLTGTGFFLKGEDGIGLDLKRTGAKVQLLGYSLQLVQNHLQIGTGNKAYMGLEKTLAMAHLANIPSLAANTAIQGWLAAIGPAIESVRSCELIERVRQIAARYGYRELGPIAAMEHTLGEAYQRWTSYRAAAQLATGPGIPTGDYRDLSIAQRSARADHRTP